jgi:hypothetical protein
MSVSENEYDDTEQLVKDEDETMADQSVASEGADTSGEVKKKYDPKDPLRPRRKKARRACFACQRAHLTCGKPTPATCYSVNGLPCQGGARVPRPPCHRLVVCSALFVFCPPWSEGCEAFGG